MGLEHFAATASADEVFTALERDGAVIVDDVLDGATLGVLRDELDPALARTAAGCCRTRPRSNSTSPRRSALVRTAPHK